MAVNGVRLVQQLEARSAELAKKVEQLEALREVGEAVSSSLDVDHVLATIAMHAVKLSGTDGGSIMEYSEQDRCFLVRSVYQTDPEVVDRLRRSGSTSTRRWSDGPPGSAARSRCPTSTRSTSTRTCRSSTTPAGAPWPPCRCCVRTRSSGRLIVRRRRTGEFSEETLDLLETFASQSALALLNAQLFRELKEQSVELELASRHKSEFLASMSHELRTPLNAVLGFSEVLLERMFGDINERQEEYLRDIHGSGKHLLELLNEILDLSKVEAGRMELEYSSFDLRPLLERRCLHAARAGRAHAIDVGVETGDDVGPVYSDELRLKQVVLNLMTNAVKFTGDGGSVEVRAVRQGSGDRDHGGGHRASASPRRTASGSSSPSSRAGGAARARRAPASASPCRGASSSCSAAACGSRPRSGSGSTFGFSLPARCGRTAGHSRGRRPAGAVEVVVIEDDRPSLDLFSAYLSGADAQGHQRRATASPVSRRCGGASRTPCCWTSGCPASTGGRCWRRSGRRRTRVTSR